MNRIILPLALFAVPCFGINTIPYVGIPVPGQTMSPKDIIDHYIASCNSQQQQSDLLTNAFRLLQGPQAEEVSRRLYQGLFSATQPFSLDQLEGRWFRVIDSPTGQSDKCHVMYDASKPSFLVNSLQNSTFLSTMTTQEYFRIGGFEGDISSVQGIITKTGADPGEVLLTTGYYADTCPYFVIKVGPNSSYFILSQLLKNPVLVYARDPLDFEARHRHEVWSFLKQQNFVNVVTTQYNLVQATNITNCPVDYYWNL